MEISQHKSSIADGSATKPTTGAGVKLPPIVRPTDTDKNVPTGPLAGGGIITGTGKSDAISDRFLIYRSVPPTPKNNAHSDMIGAEIVPPSPVKAKKVGLSGSASSEFAKRFVTRQTRAPKVVDFNIGRFGTERRRRGTNGFFPSVKLRVGGKSQTTVSQKENKEQHLEPLPSSGSSLQLIPTAVTEVQPKSAASRSISRASKQSAVHSRANSRKTPESVRTAPAAPETVIVYPETFECDDLSYLPPPKRILPKRDVPWVFRYKVKRNMNELSKIMASKPQSVDV